MMYDGVFIHGVGLLWFVALAVPFAIGFYFVAGRIGQSPLLWAVLAVIPIVNFFFGIYAFFSVLLYILDRLNQAAPRHRALA